jgi:hypothetical protein
MEDAVPLQQAFYQSQLADILWTNQLNHGHDPSKAAICIWRSNLAKNAHALIQDREFDFCADAAYTGIKAEKIYVV